MKKGFLFTFLFFTCLVAADDACSSGAAVSNADFDGLIANLTAQSFESGKIEVLATFVNGTSLGFTGEQTAKILSEFGFSSNQEIALNVLGNHILSLTAFDIALVLEKLQFSSGRLDALSYLADYGLQESLKLNETVILDLFEFSSDKEKARKIIADAKGRTCSWGAVTQPLVVFVIDVSGSMSTKFQLGGVTYTRLSFVQKEIDLVVRNQLRTDQQFNVISFSTSASAWSPGLQPVTVANIDSAVRWSAGLRAGGGTYSRKAFQLAFDQLPTPEAIFFLGDGDPTDGASSNLSLIAELEAAASRNIPIYTTALAADAGGRKFLRDVAEQTGGVYREINGE